MSTSEDFEKRRRERVKKQREKRRRMMYIRRRIIALVILALIIAGICALVSKCGKDDNAETDNPNAVVSEIPYEQPTQTPEVNTTYKNSSNIPAPSVGDNEYLNVIKESGQKKHVYLTFDNGPDADITPQILDVLRRYNIKATFFMVGKQIENNAAVCARVQEEGHLAAVYSYSGDQSVMYGNETVFMDEVEKTYQLIADNAPDGSEPFKLFRFPGGTYNGAGYMDKKTAYMKPLAEAGFYYCDWNSIIGDDVGETKTSQELLDYFNRNRPKVNNLVIKMHDKSGKQNTVDMLSKLIDQLLEEGYTFSRLDEIDFANEIDEDTENEPENDGETENTQERATEAPQTTTAPSGTSAGSTKKNTNSSSTSNSSTTSGSSSKSSSSTKSDTSSSAQSGSSSTGKSNTSSSQTGSSGGTSSQSGTSSTQSSTSQNNTSDQSNVDAIEAE